LVGSPRDLDRIACFLGGGVPGLVVEHTPDDHWQVRISAAPCRHLRNGRCGLQSVKPRGGREFECWNPETFERTYYWSREQLAQIGFVAPET